MTIFSEIYGAYYRIAARALMKNSLTESEVNELIGGFGFRDSALFLPQKLLPQKDGSDWGLLRKNTDGTLSRITENPPPAVLTLLQKRWLKAKLEDERFRLFFDDKTFTLLAERLADVKPLYRRVHFRYFDKFTDGDDYSDPRYRENFRTVLAALKSRELIKVSFTSGHGKRIGFTCLPIKLEYSEKNDKLRVLTRKVRNGRLSGGGILNLGRLGKAERTGVFCNESADIRSDRIKEPVTIYVKPERNAVERFLMEFASFEKRAERDLESGGCTVSMYFDKSDETEMLIRILSFGAAVEILSPPDFRRQAAERVAKQAELFVFNNNEVNRNLAQQRWE